MFRSGVGKLRPARPFMLLVGTYRNINYSRESSRRLRGWKYPFFTLSISAAHFFICGLSCKKHCVRLSPDLRLLKVVWHILVPFGIFLCAVWHFLLSWTWQPCKSIIFTEALLRWSLLSLKKSGAAAFRCW